MNAEELLKYYGPVLTIGASLISGCFAFLGWKVSKRNSIELQELQGRLSQVPADRDNLIKLRETLNSLRPTGDTLRKDCMIVPPYNDIVDLEFSPASFLKTLRAGLLPFYRVETDDIFQSVTKYLSDNPIRFDGSDLESEELAKEAADDNAKAVNEILDLLDNRIKKEIERLDAIVRGPSVGGGNQ